jgi:hypothetical protein
VYLQRWQGLAFCQQKVFDRQDFGKRLWWQNESLFCTEK